MIVRPPRPAAAARFAVLAAPAVLAVLAGCAQQPLNPFGRPYDVDNVLKPGVLNGCAGAHDVSPYLEFGSRAMYPATQHLNAKGGDVVVQFRIRGDGRVEPLTAAEGPNRPFILHLNAAAQDWRVRPATLKGAPVDVVCSFSQSYRIVGPWAPNAEDSERGSRF